MSAYEEKNVAQVPVVEHAVPAGAPFSRPVDAVKPRGPIANAIDLHAGAGQVHQDMADVGRAVDGTLDARIQGGGS